jgi:hypothetical protein
LLLTILCREEACPDNPRPGIEMKREPLKGLVPIKAIASPSSSKGKSEEEKEMEEGAIKRARSMSLTVLEYNNLGYIHVHVFVRRRYRRV